MKFLLERPSLYPEGVAVPLGIVRTTVAGRDPNLFPTEKQHVPLEDFVRYVRFRDGFVLRDSSN